MIKIIAFVDSFKHYSEPIKEFQKRLWKKVDFLKLKPSSKKNISEIIWKKQYFSVWFSDDNLKNIVSVYEKFRVFLDSEKYFPEVQKKFSVYFTWKSEEYYNLLMMLWDEEHFREQIKQKYWLKIKLKK